VAEKLWMEPRLPPCGCRKCHPVLLIREFSHLVAPTTMWEIEIDSLGNGTLGSVIVPG
jgi:hypothetical protein